MIVRAKPAGVLGAEIWVNGVPVGRPTPTDPASFNFVALEPGHEYASKAVTRTPYTLDFAGADGSKNANYLLRWVNSRGDTGPPALNGPRRTKFAVAQRPLAAGQGWSETATATIGA